MASLFIKYSYSKVILDCILPNCPVRGINLGSTQVCIVFLGRKVTFMMSSRHLIGKCR